jgi:hypothetical protein
VMALVGVKGNREWCGCGCSDELPFDVVAALVPIV